MSDTSKKDKKKITIIMTIILILACSLLLNLFIGIYKSEECMDSCKPDKLEYVIGEYQHYNLLIILIPFSELFNQYETCVCISETRYNFSIKKI